jgi:hypothetical protein
MRAAGPGRFKLKLSTRTPRKGRRAGGAFSMGFINQLKQIGAVPSPGQAG